MRTLILFTLLFSLTLFFACDDDIATPTKPIDLLPPATQEGNYTFGCLVNGEAFVTKSSTSVVAIYQAGILQLSGTLNNKLVFIDIGGVPIKVGDYTLRSTVIQDGKGAGAR